MKHCCWLALSTAAIVLAALVVPSVHAQRCPFTAQLQFQMQLQMMPRSNLPQMTVPNYQFQTPMYTPPRVNIPNWTTPSYPTYRTKFPTTPAYNVRIPTFKTTFTPHTSTRWLTNLNEFTSLRFSTKTTLTPHTESNSSLSLERLGMLTWGKHDGTVPWESAWLSGRVGLDMKMMPSLFTTSMHTTSQKTTWTPLAEKTWTPSLTTAERLLRIPSLSFNNRPLITPAPRIPVATLRKPPTPAWTVQRQPARPAVTPAPSSKARTPMATLSAKVTVTCGSCHNCAQKPQAPSMQLTQVFAAPPRQRIVPLLPAVPRPVPALVSIQTMPLQPAMPSVFVPPTMTPIRPTGGMPSLTELLTAPPLPPSAKMLVESPESTAPSLAELPGAEVFADPNPPMLPTLRPEEPRLMELMVGADPAKRTTEPLQMEALLQPPLLPSGAMVALGDEPTPALDEPPVLPSLIEVLTEPPPLPGES